MKKNKIIIGTVQFGQHYGVTNKLGKTGFKEVKKIINFAKKKNINTLDTSFHYGQSETILGKINIDKFKVITKFKISKSDEKSNNIKKLIINRLVKSKSKMKINVIHGVLLQSSDVMFKNNGKKIFETLVYAKKIGLIKKFGYSLYSFSRLSTLCKKFPPDIIQCPFNVLDRRLWKNNLKFMKNKNIEVHVRSIFLQGLLLMPFKSIPKSFHKYQNLFLDWDRWLKKQKISAIKACLNFVANTKDIDKIIVGVNNLNQLKEILSIKLNKRISIPKKISSNDPRLIYPYLW